MDADKAQHARSTAASVLQQEMPMDRSLAQLIDTLNARTAQVQRLVAVIDALTTPARDEKAE